jgi:hypothetical protein
MQDSFRFILNYNWIETTSQQGTYVWFMVAGNGNQIKTTTTSKSISPSLSYMA